MDAVPHRGSAALGVPAPAPRHGEVLVGAVPERLARGHQGASEHAVGDQPPQPQRRRAEPVLVDREDRNPGRLADGGELVDLGEAERGGLLHEHRHARPHRRDREGRMGLRRCADRDDVEVRGGEQLIRRRVGRRPPEAIRELRRTRRVEVGDADEDDPGVELGDRGRVGPGDGAGADDAGPQRWGCGGHEDSSSSRCRFRSIRPA